MSEHTPGPWRVLPLEGKYYGTKVDLGGRCIVAVWVRDACGTVSEREIARSWQPNWGLDHTEQPTSLRYAHLIAAAPELLKALIMVRDADEDCKKDGLPTMPVTARATIDAAIAKAEGNTQEESNLPDWEDLRGRAPDATGSLSSEAFIREQRDAWDRSGPKENTDE